MITNRRIFKFLMFSLGVFFTACTDKWDEHNETKNPLSVKSLLEQINSNPDLSTFSSYLSKTGYAELLATSKSFTVWAPTNEALKSLDPQLIDTEEELDLFVGNHLADQSFESVSGQPSLRIKSLSGKTLSFNGTMVEESTIQVKNVSLGNGVLHTINSPLIPKMNAWEFLMSGTTMQKTELESLFYTFRDYSQAEQTGIDPKTGDPVYKPGTGYVSRNRFLQRADISNEDSLFTYIILDDDAFKVEKDKLDKYFQGSTQDSTDSLSQYNVIKDLAFRGVLDSENFPANAYSIRDSVRFHLHKSDIVSTHRVSNGIVYVMNKIDYDLISGTYDPYTKIKPILIQGEFPVSFSVAGKASSIRTRRDINGSIYRDLRVENHGVASFSAKYQISANKLKYKVYWRVVRDFNLSYTGTATDITYFPMKVAFKLPTATEFAYQPKPGVGAKINANTYAPLYDEVYLGEYEVTKYYSATVKAGPLDVHLVGNNTTANGTNTLLLDYIKMVPIP